MQSLRKKVAMFFSEMPQRGLGCPLTDPWGLRASDASVTVWLCQTLTLLVPPNDAINAGWMEAREAEPGGSGSPDPRTGFLGWL